MTSNVATASTLLPVIGAMAVAGGLDPMLLAAPVAMAASCAFMLPIATGPNAVVFASGHIHPQTHGNDRPVAQSGGNHADYAGGAGRRPACLRVNPARFPSTANSATIDLPNEREKLHG